MRLYCTACHMGYRPHSLASERHERHMAPLAPFGSRKPAPCAPECIECLPATPTPVVSPDVIRHHRLWLRVAHLEDGLLALRREVDRLNGRVSIDNVENRTLPEDWLQ